MSFSLTRVLGAMRGRLRPMSQDQDPPSDEARKANAREHLERATRLEARGESADAEVAYRTAFTLDPWLVEAHAGLAGIRWPGPDYLQWLPHLHSIHRPVVYLEIGVSTGRTLKFAQPPTLAIGVDPSPVIDCEFTAETHVLRETSDEFFRGRRLPELIGDKRIDLGFIDGLHLFEQALKDFINIETNCLPSSMIVLHDTIPLDEQTQNRVCTTCFYTGDVWKIVPCLKHYRPDLRIETIATAPTGLTIVTNLDPASRVLHERFDEAVAAFIDMPYARVEADLHAMLNIGPNTLGAAGSQTSA